MDLRGPRLVIELGVVAMGAGLLLAALVREPWQLYLSLGALVGGGVNCLAYTGQSLYLTQLVRTTTRPGAQHCLLRGRHRLDHGAALGSLTDRRCRMARRLFPAWNTGARAAGASQSAIETTARRPRSRRGRHGLEQRGRGADRERRRPCLGGSRLDIVACLADGAFLVARGRLFLRALHLVRGSGPPDQVSDRDSVLRRARPHWHWDW